MTAGWGVRAVRTAVFAAVCVVLAALGHVLMSGRDVPGWALAAGLAATAGTGWCLTGRERGPALVVPLVVAAQAALHSAFSLARTAPPGTTAPPARRTFMPMPMGSLPTDAMDMGHMAHSVGGAGRPASGMLAAHLLAALLTGLWLAYGERAAFRIVRAVAGRLAAPLLLLLALPVPADGPGPRPRRPRSDRAPGLTLLIHAITSRGPPTGTAVV
ncbi:hypothetical protein [Streptomyces sp. NPDC004658]|uniref:hypothetical protein n=1 Tax=Streptomyces sp. NPDC004658 TaxID=3154672 RepID=UPI0033B36522